jgi:hypothetical protein
MAETESQAAPPAAGGQSVQLGVGTLIIIALIVSMCSGRSEMEKIQRDNAALKEQVGEINRKLDLLLPKDAPAPDSPPPSNP